MDFIKSPFPKWSDKIRKNRKKQKSDIQKFQAKLILSLDIGQHTTKLVFGRVSKASVAVKRACMLPTPHGSMESGRILDNVELARRISEIVDAERLQPAFVFCTMENAEIITREITLPTSDDDTMENMLRFEVQQYMPVELDNYIIQSKALNSFDDNGTSKTRFLSTAVPKNLSQSYFDLLQTLNLKPAVMDVQSNSVSKLILSEIALPGNALIPADQSVAVVDFGYIHINVMIIENGTYQFNRYIAQGASGIDRSLLSYFDYSQDEIEQKKRKEIDLTVSLSISDASWHEVDQVYQREVNILKNVVDNWADELELVFKYYTSRSKGKAVQKILIHGSTTQIKGFDSYLEKVLGIPVERVQTLECVQIEDSSTDNITPYLNAIGAFIRR